jgi:hypothetical protein
MRSDSLSSLLVVAAVVSQMMACGDASGPRTQTPGSVLIISGDEQAPTEVGTRLASPLTVRVVDAQGVSIRGITVAWSATSGTFAAATSLTDPDGIARMEWTLGPVAGSQTATAAVLGKSATFRQTAIAGPLDQIILGRDTVRLLGVGDAFRLSARAADKFGNTVLVGTTVISSDTSVVTADNFGNGAILTARAPDRTATIQATAESISKVATVIVLPPPCQSGAQNVTLNVGGVTLFAGVAASEFCLQGTTAGAEFIAIPFYSDFTGSLLRLSISTGGTTTAATTNWMLPGFQVLSGAPIPLRRDDTFEAQLRERSQRELTPLIPMARLSDQQKSGRFNLAVAVPQIGDLMKFNTNSSSACTNPSIRTGRVMAITNRAIVVADTANPANGFTAQDYQSFGAGFDTLVYPVDTLNFGSPTDKDNNQHVVLFFTRAVNELTPPGQSFYIGGFFFSRDLFPLTTSSGVQGCAASNFAELLYMLVPDPTGVVNQNIRSVGFVKEVTLGTLAHELQHLINASRHLYVNGSSSFEETFLDEGLSHEAEELAFFRASGLSPRQNISYESMAAAPNVLEAFNTFEVPNFRRLREYLTNPLLNSPYSTNPSLATRGAIWSFLRYAADRRGGNEAPLWFQLANPPAAIRGLANLTRVFPELSAWVRDWTIANYADDFVPDVPALYTHPSWSLRSVMTVVNQGMWALDTQDVDSAGITSVGIADGSAAYLRFGVRPGTIGGGRITARAAPVPATFSLTVIRTK